MALLDDLVSQVPNVALRENLKRAISDLRKRQKFGLVFEEHIPETTALRGIRAQPGMLVQRKQDPEGTAPFRVESLEDSRRFAHLASENGNGRVKARTSDLLVIKRFGEPMYATLKPTSTLKRGSKTRPYHAVVNGENFHALQLFGYLYEKAVDCIYIDPPYNTGARDWKYNNRFVDSNDAWRHSKWLAMMEKRLRLAKRLLKTDGVLVVMIDEHELHHLGMLLERLFPEYLRYVVSIVVNARGSTGNRNFGLIEEQALFVVPDLGYDVIQPREAFVPLSQNNGREDAAAELLLWKVLKATPDLLSRLREAGVHLDREEIDQLEEVSSRDIGDLLTTGQDLDDLEGEEPDVADLPEEEDPAIYWRGAVRTGQGTSFRTQRPNQFYPLLFDPKRPDRVKVGKPLLDRGPTGMLAKPPWEKVAGLTPIWPVDEFGEERVWCFEPERMTQEIAKGNIKIGRYNEKRKTYAVNVRRVRRTRQRFRERTIWWERSYDAGSNGTNMLKNLLGQSGQFPFPKSLYAVRDVLATVVGSRPNALVMDFFAGSGTTLHATCLLNAGDGGGRRCILVTNNEVDEKTSLELAETGHFPGDPEYESKGIFHRVMVPRVKAAITGKRPDGSNVDGKYKWAGNQPIANGFNENIEFYELQYLDPDEVELGERFESIHPLLWLAAGAFGQREKPPQPVPFFIPAESRFAVLFKPSQLSRFLKALQERPDVTHVWVVTDSEEAYAEVCAAMPKHITRRSQLYDDYLRTFRINARRSG